MLTREQLLGGAPPVVKVEAPALGGYVYVRKMGFAERARFASIADPGSREADQPVGAITIFLTVCDEHGKRLFTTEEDFGEICQLAATDWDDVVRASLHLNGLSREAQEEIKKNSSTTPTTDSPSSSPPSSA